MIDKQDFEAYADFKRFNTYVADTWDVALREAISRSGQDTTTIRLLDYGCGDGKYFHHFVSTRGFIPENVYGAEVSSRRVQRCHDMGWANASLIDGAGPLPYEDASFDIINMMEVIEHIPAELGSRTIAELRRVLRPGGRLLISTPNYPIKRFYDLSDALLHGKWSRLRDDPTHVTHFSDRRLRHLLERSFSQVEARPFKEGYLYKRLKTPILKHKLFFLCTA
ncbi:class I SAM-dependent methyltransferase [Rhizobium etli]|uniref:class I SAM-dependent methyltransferase n=1 Tax=Rhizobium etli TaxID=29449 RepID=UPI0006854060|nr:class I SAM-dependent methyltransferase [Rhizobium etli]